MKTFRHLLLVGLVLSALALPLLSVSAQEAEATKTVTVTEAELNRLYVVSNPIRRSVTEVSFDIQDGQVVFAATVTAPQRDPWALVATYTADVADGHIVWTLHSLTVNGSPATDEQMQDFSVARLLAHPFWHYYVERFVYPRFTISDISIGSDVITVTYAHL